MLTLLILIFGLMIFGRLGIFALRATWGLTKLLVTFIFLPVIIVGFLLIGLIPLAIIALAVIGVFSVIAAAA